MHVLLSIPHFKQGSSQVSIEHRSPNFEKPSMQVPQTYELIQSAHPVGHYLHV